MANRKISRRGLLGSAALAAVAPGVLPAQANKSQANKFWTNEYWAKKPSAGGEVPLYMFRKRLSAPKAGEKLPVLFLVHGSSNSSRSSFDLNVPGGETYSAMEVFARLGFDVWTLDHENYGRSGKTSGNSDIKSGVEDLKVAVELVVKETGQQKMHFLGESSGGLRAGAYAMARPDRVDRLVLAAFTYKGEGSPTLAQRAQQLDYYRTHNLRKRDREMIRSIFTRDKPGTADPKVAEFMADEELKFGDQVPTGTYLDMTANLPVVDPLKVLCPVLLVRGEYDGIATVADLSEFFSKLPNGDRQFVMLPGTAHSVGMGLNRKLAWHVVNQFLSMPKAV